MINIDDRLLELIPKIGADSFTVLLLIAKRINKKNEAFPSRATLQLESGFGEGKVDKCLKILKDNNLISSKQRHVGGKLSSCLYGIETDYVGVFVSAKGYQFSENSASENQYLENQGSENQVPENQRTDFRVVSIKQSSLSINQDLEVLNIVDFSENCTDLSANADQNSKFLNKEISLSKSQSLEAKPKEAGQFEGKLSGIPEELGVKPIKSDYPEDFERLWVAYSAVAKGAQGGKQDAKRAWLKVKNKASPQELEKAIAAYSLSTRVKEGFVMNFSTFLNSGRWETELENDSNKVKQSETKSKKYAFDDSETTIAPKYHLTRKELANV